MLKIDFYTKKEDFALNYFSKIYWDEKNALDNSDVLENIISYFDIDKSKIKSIKNINKEIREDLFIRYNAKENQKDLIYIEKYFSPIDEALMKKIIDNLNIYRKIYEYFRRSFWRNRNKKYRNIIYRFYIYKILSWTNL